MTNVQDEIAFWIGSKVRISGEGGRICEADGFITTKWETGRNFVIERVSVNKVAFRLVGTDLFLTQTLYGIHARAGIMSILSQKRDLLPEIVSKIADFVVDQATTEDNFEGPGYNYTPMTAQPGPPNILQTFTLVPVSRSTFGIRSRFGTYWRSEHWNGVVSQSPHLERDEHWVLEHV